VLASLTSSLTSYVRDHGLYAIFVLMLVDAMLPAASELVMVVGGALAAGAFGASVTLFGVELSKGFPAYLAVALAGTIGYLVGALIGWAIGRFGGRPLLERRGRWLHVGPAELARAERWFERYEDWAVFLGRITPVVRSFVSIPAGVFRVPLGRYTVLTFAGSAIWCFLFAGIGWAVGSSYERVHHDFGFVEIAVVAGIVAVAAYLIVRRTRASRLGRRASEPDSSR
jgi:membrane protein DedA with SNARE-associated domain